jgi:anti-anti-sigma factor
MTQRSPGPGGAASVTASVTLSGSLDVHRVGEVTRCLHDAIPDGPEPQLGLDLTRVTSISPVGLDVLLAVQERLEARGGRLVLLELNATVVRLLHDVLLEDEDPSTAPLADGG